MYKEIDENGQYQLDCRLSGERTMEENVNVMVQFATDIRKEEVGDVKVKNCHEGYGFLADAQQTLKRTVKIVDTCMNDLLGTLSVDETTAIDKTESVANALADAIVVATKMAAEAKRVSGDLFSESWSSPSPLETYLNENADNDGFEEPEPETEEGEENGEN
jgi:hypothetical protein